MDRDKAVGALARRQHGLVTRAQARECGFSDDSVDWRMKNGLWQPAQRGVVRLPGAPVTLHQKILAPCLAIPGSTASYRAAAALWEIPDILGRPEITVLKFSKVRLEDVVVHRADRMDRRDRVWRSGIPVTSLPRTVIDLAGALTRERTRAIVTHLLARRRLSLQLLSSRVEDLGTQGRRGAGDLAELLVELKGRKRHVDSGAQRRLERLLLEAAKQGRLPTPYFEYPVQLSNGEWRYPDAGYPDHLTGVELLSYEHHASLPAFAHDLDRNLEFLEEEWFLIPITDLHVRNEPDRLVDLIAKVLARREVRNENRAEYG
jgi:hypothetical protein